ncbi:hypothetical protein F5J12DRAFT_784835 [Pisolithus orientalis]|uniref:uncharacterized protein n=1 Tax=Pisolithus orientalis TaxID=936130 RepID=UPI0022248DA6|nr:uncharacterized protein F5J12DRAFT_784835 [Pisolithus orientalis]KAI5998485.1 hypothetical protein F5J12DRAFT_784835 [Pisolithus orientalis]
MQPSHMLSHSQAFPEMIPNAQVLQDMINRLQQENTTLKAECTAMQLTLNQPDQSALSDRFLNISLKSPPITTMPFLNVPPVLQLNQADYPKDWKAIHMTVQGQASSAMAFIEDANRQELVSKKITNVLQTMWNYLDVDVAASQEGILWMDEKTNSATKCKMKSEVVKDADSPTGVRNVKCTKINVFTAPDNSNDDGLHADSMPVIPVAPTLNTVEQEDDTGISAAAQLIKNPLSSLCPPPVVRDLPEPTMTISESHMSTIDKGESQAEAPSTTNGPTTHRWNEEEGMVSSFEQEWQKQVGRSLEEFNKYFDELPSEVKAKYKDEANDLVECKIWIHRMAAVVAKFSGEQEQQGKGSVDEREHRQRKGGTIKQNKR